MFHLIYSKIKFIDFIDDNLYAYIRENDIEI